MAMRRRDGARRTVPCCKLPAGAGGLLPGWPRLNPTPPDRGHVMACAQPLHHGTGDGSRYRSLPPLPLSASTTPGPHAPLRRPPTQRAITLRPLLTLTAGSSDALWEVQTGRDLQATARP